MPECRRGKKLAQEQRVLDAVPGGRAGPAWGGWSPALPCSPLTSAASSRGGGASLTGAGEPWLLGLTPSSAPPAEGGAGVTVEASPTQGRSQPGHQLTGSDLEGEGSGAETKFHWPEYVGFLPKPEAQILSHLPQSSLSGQGRTVLDLVTSLLDPRNSHHTAPQGSHSVSGWSLAPSLQDCEG